MDLLPHTIAGIPCQIGVSSYIRVKPWRGSPASCPSSADYYGYEECSWELYDRKGYRARWLDKKLSRYETDLVEQAIHEFYTARENEEP